jgi:hypothetical protein
LLPNAQNWAAIPSSGLRPSKIGDFVPQVLRIMTALTDTSSPDLRLSLNTGIPRFTLLMWGHIKKRGKQKPRKSSLFSSNKGES